MGLRDGARRTASSFLVLDRHAIRTVLTLDKTIEIAEAALRKTSNGTASQDMHRTLALPGLDGACLSVMCAAIGDRCNAVLIGGTGTGKPHLAIGIARALIRNGSRGRYFRTRLSEDEASVAMAAAATHRLKVQSLRQSSRC